MRGLLGQSFQSWLVRLPVRENGMGLRSLVDTIPAAFIGSVEMSLPFFGGDEGVCRVLEPIMGDIQSESTDRRWHKLLSSDCRTGREFADCWELLQGEATDCCTKVTSILPSLSLMLPVLVPHALPRDHLQ